MTILTRSFPAAVDRWGVAYDKRDLGVCVCVRERECVLVDAFVLRFDMRFGIQRLRIVDDKTRLCARIHV